MNNIILSLICISMFAISGCSKVSTGISDKTDGEFKGVVSNWSIDLNDQNGVSFEKLIVDEQLALEIGNAVIKAVYNEEILTQTSFLVYELEDEDIFIVSRIPKESKLGGDYNVAISKSNAAILKVWVGE